MSLLLLYFAVNKLYRDSLKYYPIESYDNYSLISLCSMPNDKTFVTLHYTFKFKINYTKREFQPMYEYLQLNRLHNNPQKL